jgi:hypothetical protein
MKNTKPYMVALMTSPRRFVIHRKIHEPYYTLFVYCPDSQEWFDEFGSYFLQEIKTEIEWSHFDKPKRFVKIGCHDDTAAAMKIARDCLPVPAVAISRKILVA